VVNTTASAPCEGASSVMPVFLPEITSARPRMPIRILPGSNRIASTYRKEVPLEFADQCVLGRSKVKDSLVLGLMIWNVAPTFVGSSPLPGVGRMKGPRDRKLSLSRAMLAFRMRRVPLTSWSAANAGGAVSASNAGARTDRVPTSF